MGALVELGTGATTPLLALHRVGRAPSCALVLLAPWVSREHATLAWTGAAWELRDLGSHNGTWVDGARLAPGSRVALAPGARLGFGAEEHTHALVDAGPPEPLARLPDGAWIVGRGGWLELAPGEEGGPVVLKEASTGRWLLEADGRARAVRDEEEVVVGGVSLLLRLPGQDALTVPRGLAPEPRVRFTVSQDEEHVRLVVEEDGRRFDLGSRSHHYLLLTLARARRADAALAPPAQGWVDAEELAHRLRLDPRYLNVQVFRARKQAADAGLACAHRLVERRDPGGHLRLGLAEVEIER